MEKPVSLFIDSGNTIINNSGESNNHIYNFTNIINGQKKAIPNDSTIIEDQKDVMKEETFEFVWKYLSLKDKFNCTLVCKRFNNFIYEMDCLRPNISKYWRFNYKKPVPIFTRTYRTLVFESFDMYRLSPRYLQMLKYLSCSVVELKFNHFSTKVKKMCKLLGEFPLLESLELDNISFEGSKLSIEKLPKLLHLKNLKIDAGWFSQMSGVLPLLSSAQNIQSFTLKYAKMEIKELNNFLNQLKNSLESLSFKSCKIISDPLDPDWNCFDCLYQLRKLRLIHSDEITKKVLTSKSIYGLTDLEIKYNFSHKDKVNYFLRSYFKLKEINDLQLLEYEASEEPIITKTKCPNSGNIITTFYHFHHCTSKSLHCYDHNKCKPIPSTNLELDWIQNKNFKAFLLIQVRKDVKDFKILKIE